MKYLIKRICIFLSSVGIEPIKIINLAWIFSYIKDLWRFKKMGGYVQSYFPILSDYHQQAGSLPRDYFLQDLHVASIIFKSQPKRHLDVGSRLDGFIAHVASFRKIEVMDIRPLQISIHDNISFVQADLMLGNKNLSNNFDSISCLHAIEHFGLGRYNDPINPKGYCTGFNNILNMLELNGKLYISFPVGKKNEVQFNAQRVFHPTDILSWSHNKNQVKLLQFDFIDDNQHLHNNLSPFDQLPTNSGCGIYIFTKIE